MHASSSPSGRSVGSRLAEGHTRRAGSSQEAVAATQTREGERPGGQRGGGECGGAGGPEVPASPSLAQTQRPVTDADRRAGC